MKYRVTLYANGERVISCDFDGMKEEYMDDISSNLLLCAISRAIDGMSEEEALEFVDKVKSFDYGIEVERFEDVNRVPHEFKPTVFDKITECLRSFFLRGDA